MRWSKKFDDDHNNNQNDRLFLRGSKNLDGDSYPKPNKIMNVRKVTKWSSFFWDGRKIGR